MNAKKYILQLDNIIEAAQKEARRLEAAVTSAEAKCRQLRVDRIGHPSAGSIDPDTMIAALRAKADLEESTRAKQKFWMWLPDEIEPKIAAIRAELAHALDDAYSAHPSKMDAQTVALLDANILDAHELAKLLDEFAAKDNTTMTRMIAAAAKRKAAEVEGDLANGGKVAADEYFAVASAGEQFSRRAEQYLGLFDSYANAIKTAARNQPMLLGDDLAQFSADALTAVAALS